MGDLTIQTGVMFDPPALVAAADIDARTMIAI